MTRKRDIPRYPTGNCSTFLPYCYILEVPRESVKTGSTKHHCQELIVPNFHQSIPRINGNHQNHHDFHDSLTFPSEKQGKEWKNRESLRMGDFVLINCVSSSSRNINELQKFPAVYPETVALSTELRAHGGIWRIAHGQWATSEYTTVCSSVNGPSQSIR